MNREHKYRAYIKSEKKFKYFTLQEIYNIGSTYWENKWWDEIREFNEYTGLKDKNGKEIYEGDIFNYDGEIDTIDSIEDFYFNELIEYRMSEGKIIGNIYENPELLKELKK